MKKWYALIGVAVLVAAGALSAVLLQLEKEEPIALDRPLSHAHITVYKSPACDCCGNYIAELRKQGAEITVEEMDDSALAARKEEWGIDPDLQSCHTSVMDGYVIEGHVPFEALARLRTERPELKGIALAGMPAGSPGMPGIKSGPFSVKTLEGETFGEF